MMMPRIDCCANARLGPPTVTFYEEYTGDIVEMEYTCRNCGRTTLAEYGLVGTTVQTGLDETEPAGDVDAPSD